MKEEDPEVKVAARRRHGRGMLLRTTKLISPFALLLPSIRLICIVVQFWLQ